MFRKFTLRHRSTVLCSNVVKFVQREIGEIVCYLPDKEQTKFRLLLLRGLRPKSATTSPQHWAHTVQDFIQIGSLSAELKLNA